MEPVSSFESLSPAADGEEALKRGLDYRLVVQALMAAGLTVMPDGIVAENILARIAKRQVRTDLGTNTRMMLTTDPYLPHIMLYCAVSAATEIPTACSQTQIEEVAGALYALAKRLGRTISESRSSEDQRLFLIDAMDIKILEIAPRCYSFRLSQKWGVE